MNGNRLDAGNRACSVIGVVYSHALCGRRGHIEARPQLRVRAPRSSLTLDERAGIGVIRGHRAALSGAFERNNERISGTHRRAEGLRAGSGILVAARRRRRGLIHARRAGRQREVGGSGDSAGYAHIRLGGALETTGRGRNTVGAWLHVRQGVRTAAVGSG